MEPEIGLSELHKIKTRSKFGNNNPADPVLTTVEPEDIENTDNLLEQNSSLIDNELALEHLIEQP